MEANERAAWLGQRRHSLGASEVAAVCGLDPFKSKLDVWGSKMGWLRQEDSDAADMGNLLEPVLLQRYADLRQVALRQVGTLYGPESWISCTPDGLVVGGSQWLRDVQVKCVGRHMADHWDHGAPDYVHAQVQWELMVTGLQSADVVALICSTEFRIIPIDRDQTLIDNILTICRAFWFEHVAENQMPEVDGSETALAILRAMHPERGKAIAADDELIAMAQQHQAQAAALDVAGEELKALRNRIRQNLGEAPGAEWPGGRITYRTNKAGDRPLLVRTK